eukprot:COSAG02_NODE_56853_length_283_cov_0.885870_1_plen_45_part_10
MALLDCSRLASAKEARNECCSVLIGTLTPVVFTWWNAVFLLGALP